MPYLTLIHLPSFDVSTRFRYLFKVTWSLSNTFRRPLSPSLEKSLIRWSPHPQPLLRLLPHLARHPAQQIFSQTLTTVVLVATPVLQVYARKAPVLVLNALLVAVEISEATATAKVSASVLPQQIQHPTTVSVVKMLVVTNRHWPLALMTWIVLSLVVQAISVLLTPAVHNLHKSSQESVSRDNVAILEAS